MNRKYKFLFYAVVAVSNSDVNMTGCFFVAYHCFQAGPVYRP